MPVISPYGAHEVAMGYGTISIMGSTPAALVGRTGNQAHWFDDGVIVYQDYTAAPVLNTYDTVTLALTTVDSAGGNAVGGGAGVWAAWLSGQGVRTSVGGLGPFPNGGAAGQGSPTLVSELGQTLFITNYATASGVSCYGPTGTPLASIATSLVSTVLHIRQNVIAYQSPSGWLLVNALTGVAIPSYRQRPNILFCIPFTLGTDIGVLEYQTTTSTLTIRIASELTGLTIPTVGTEFNPDVQGIDADTVRVAWSTGQGELPGELVILDIDTTTGTTEEGTVVGGSVVFAEGPTLEGTTFTGAQAGLNSLPVQSQKVLNSAGELAKPWRDALQRLSGGVQAAQTAINVLPVTVPPDGFGSVGGVTASGPDATLTLTSADGTVTITPDQATSSVDLSASGGGSQWIPLVDGSEPPNFITNGAGVLILVSYA